MCTLACAPINRLRLRDRALQIPEDPNHKAGGFFVFSLFHGSPLSRRLFFFSLRHQGEKEGMRTTHKKTSRVRQCLVLVEILWRVIQAGCSVECR